MNIKLIHFTPLGVADLAISKCWDKKKDTIDIDRIYRVANKNKHSSTIEHIVYSFDVDGISRACLQELARHRIASLSVKSTRYTLKELKDEKCFNVYSDLDRAGKYCVLTYNEIVDEQIVRSLEGLRQCLAYGVSNDIAKYCLPESYKTSLVLTINARSLQNFLSLRSSKAALWEMRELASAIFAKIPQKHRFLFEEFVDETN